MSLRDALKKAAGLVIEFSPDEDPPATPNAAVTTSATDKMWDDLEQSVKPAAAAQTAVGPSVAGSAIRLLYPPRRRERLSRLSATQPDQIWIR